MTAGDFALATLIFDPQQLSCICPAGKQLYRNGQHNRHSGYQALIFTGAKRDCVPCALRQRCLQHPQRTLVRQVTLFIGWGKQKPPSYTQSMKDKIDTELGRYYYSRRLGIVEPVFGNICNTHRLKRFGLRAKRKVNNQWLLYALVHNIGKVQRFGKATDNAN